MVGVAAHGDVLGLGQVENIGDRLRAEGELPVVTVTDSRSAAQAILAGGPGLADPQLLARADQESRTGSTSLTAGLTLDLPVDAVPGVSALGRVAVEVCPRKRGWMPCSVPRARGAPVTATVGKSVMR
jgi:hypothetical protein